MSSLAFVMPVHGRREVARLAMRSLARTIQSLEQHGLEAGAFVVGDEPPLLEFAEELGFGTVPQENSPLGRKFSDGYQAATDPYVIDRPFDHVIPIGSDDWIDPELVALARLPEEDEIVCFTRATFVSENGTTAATVRITYPGGLGLRIIPRALIAATGYRPTPEDRMRGIDSATLRQITDTLAAFDRPAPRLRYFDLHPAQIVDWKTRRYQLNPWETTLPYQEGALLPVAGIRESLEAVFGADLVGEMLELYA